MRCLFLLTLLLAWHSAFTQQYYETYSPANGLVDARVTRIMQDGTGRLFFLTRDGISIYDGQRFTNHTRASGNPIGIVNDGLLLPDGSLLLGNFNGDWIHCTRNKIERDTQLIQSIQELSKVIVTGSEKFFVSNHGVFRLEKNNRTKNLGLPKAPGQTISEIVYRKDRFVYSYFINGSYMLYVAGQDGQPTDSLKIPPLYSIVADKKGNIQLCTSNGILQLNVEELEKNNLKIEKSWIEEFVPQKNITTSLFFDKQDNIWLINEMTGCTRINPSNKSTYHYSTQEGLLAGTRSIFQDKENNYWFIAPGKGVQKLVQTNYEVVNKLGNEPVHLVLSSQATSDGRLFIFANRKLLMLDKETIVNVPYTPSSFSGYVYHWQNNFWAHGSSGQLVNNKGRSINLTDTTRPDISHYPSPHSNIDKAGNLLLAGNHISLIQPDEWATTIALPYFADNIVADDQNNYWAFCRSDDIVQLRVANGKLRKTSSQRFNNIGARYTIHYNKDTFWIATRLNGILIAKVTGQSFQVVGRITREHGLSNDFVETLLQIDKRRIAAGTASGLDIITIDGADTLVENLSQRIDHFEPILQLCRDGQGMIYARTEDFQLFKYDPDPLASPAYDPGTWISRITVNDKDPDSTQTKFNHLHNNFRFWITSPSFSDSRSIHFQFLLKGESRQWEQKSNSAEFAISNLPPGKYHLSVLIKYPGRIYADKKIDHYFTILPPFWKTWWFITALLCIIALCTLYFVRTYLRRQLQKQMMIMEKELAIEQERTKMARELHDGLGSMLSGVKHSFSAMKNRLELEGPESEKFNYNIDKLNDSIKELRNISHSMASESLLKYGLENSLKDYCQHISQAGELGISFEALSTGDMLLTEEQSFHIFRIVQELLQNIIQHSGASQAIIQLSYNQQRLYITVEDNGKGFEWNGSSNKATGQGMGLKNIESRVKTLHGRLDYKTAPGKGTSVMVEIPCKEKK